MNESNSNNALSKIVAFLKTVDVKSIAKDIILSIVTSIGSITYGAFRFWAQCDTGLLTILLLVLGFALLWGSFFYVRFWKKEKQERLSVDAMPWGKPSVKREHRYSERARRLALIGIVAVPVIAAAYFAVSEYIKSIPSEQFIILIAEFEGPDPAKYRVREIMEEGHIKTGNGNTRAEGLKKGTQKFSSELKIEHTCVISNKDDEGTANAKKVGRDHKARIVIWGDYSLTETHVLVKIRFEVLRPSENQSKIKKNESSQSMPREEIMGFTIQTKLSNEMTYLTLLVMGLERYENGKYDEALERIDAALQHQRELPDDFVNPDVAHFFNGLCHHERALRPNAPKKEIETAIKEYDQVIGNLNIPALPGQENELRWKAHFNRTNANLVLAQYATDQEALEIVGQATEDYQNAFNDYVNAGISEWAVKNNWGFALFELGRRLEGQDARDRLKESLAKYRDAIDVCTGEQQNCAVSYYNLGNSLYKLAGIEPEKDQYLESAEVALHRALDDGYSPESDVKNSLASVLVLRGESPGNDGERFFREAAKTYESLLEVYQKGSQEYPRVQYNLGYALLALSQRVSDAEASEVLREADIALRAVRDASCGEQISRFCATVKADLARALARRAQRPGEDRTRYLTEARENFDNALLFFTQVNYPVQNARIRNERNQAQRMIASDTTHQSQSHGPHN